MTAPRVSIIILSFMHPEITNICLRQLQITEGVDYEVIVVDNGSDEATVRALEQHRDEGRITTLYLSPVNTWYAQGNNIGVSLADPASEIYLLLNSDVAAIRSDWLTKLLAWMDGTAMHRPAVWGLNPQQPRPGPRDIVSFGWSHDINVQPGLVRPEGWCIAYRSSVWQDMDTRWPWLYCLEEQIGRVMRAGASCGVLWNYSTLVVHREGGSGKDHVMPDCPPPDIAAWLSGLDIEPIDFRMTDERASYVDWA